MSKPTLIKRIFPIVIVIVISILIATGFVITRTKAKHEAIKEKRVPVEVMKAKPLSEQIVINAMGTVIPAKKLQLNPEINGKIIKISPNLIPGKIVLKGELLVKIDPRNYEVLFKQQQARLQEARAALALEQGRQTVAKHEWKMMHNSNKAAYANKALVLREPQLVSAQAAVTLAENAVKQARLNLQKTEIHASFNAIVQSKNTALGQLASPQQPLAILIGADYFWVQASLSLKDLALINTENTPLGKGAVATITNKVSKSKLIIKHGKVIELLGDLSPAGRMARLLIKVDNPLGINDTASLPLLLNSYVNIKIQGPRLDNVFAIPREVIHEGNLLWLMTKDAKLDIIPINILMNRDNDILVNQGIKSGALIITSNISIPVEGILLKNVTPGKELHDKVKKS